MIRDTDDPEAEIESFANVARSQARRRGERGVCRSWRLGIELADVSNRRRTSAGFRYREQEVVERERCHGHDDVIWQGCPATAIGHSELEYQDRVNRSHGRRHERRLGCG